MTRIDEVEEPHAGLRSARLPARERRDAEARMAAARGGHHLFETGDADAPHVIKDRNGEVVLGLCRLCGKAEVELSGPCIPALDVPSHRPAAV